MCGFAKVSVRPNLAQQVVKTVVSPGDCADSRIFSAPNAVVVMVSRTEYRAGAGINHHTVAPLVNTFLLNSATNMQVFLAP